MKRMCIYVLYDEYGIVDNYVFYLIKQMKKVVDKFIVIVNGTICDIYENKLKKEVDIYIQRENVGFDAGAYKFFFTQIFSSADYKEYDEIILMNDSFYGPLFPIEDMFAKFENRKNDFWGITKHQGGFFKNGHEFKCHIQSYFIVIRKSLFQNYLFRQFWEEMLIPQKFEEAISDFEINFSVYFNCRGFKSECLTDIQGCEIGYNINPYLEYPYELITEYQIPFLKKKSMVVEEPEYVDIINFLHEESYKIKYDVNLILDNISRLKEERRLSLYNEKEMVEFCKKFKNIYIYWNGKYGKNIEKYLRYRGFLIKGFIVTDKADNTRTKNFKECRLDKNDGLILAMGRKNQNQVLEIIGDKILREQIFY